MLRSSPLSQLQPWAVGNVFLLPLLREVLWPTCSRKILQCSWHIWVVLRNKFTFFYYLKNTQCASLRTRCSKMETNANGIRTLRRLLCILEKCCKSRLRTIAMLVELQNLPCNLHLVLFVSGCAVDPSHELVLIASCADETNKKITNSVPLIFFYNFSSCTLGPHIGEQPDLLSSSHLCLTLW